MTPEPADWIKRRCATGKLILNGKTITVGLCDAERIGERVAICMFDGGLTESEADAVAENEYQNRQTLSTS